MTAATVAPARTEDEIIIRAWQTYRRAMLLGESVRLHIAGPLAALEDALDLYGAIERREIRGDDQPGDPEPEYTALREAAEAVAEWEAELIRVCPALRSDKGEGQ